MNVLGELVAKGHGLRVLQVGESRSCRVDVVGGLLKQRTLEHDHRARDQPSVVAQEHPEVRGHLVVAGPTGAKLAAEDPEALGEPALKCRVNVLVGRHGRERT